MINSTRRSSRVVTFNPYAFSSRRSLCREDLSIALDCAVERASMGVSPCRSWQDRCNNANRDLPFDPHQTYRLKNRSALMAALTM